MELTSRDWRGLLTLSGELAEISADDPAAAASHAMGSLYDLMGADEGFLLFSRRVLNREAHADPLSGWRPVQVFQHRRAAERSRILTDWYTEPGRLLEDVTVQHITRTAGRPRAYLHGDLMGEAEWRRQPTVAELMRGLGVRDRLVGAAPVGAGLEVFIGMDRVGGRDFVSRQRDVLQAALTHIRWFFRHLARYSGVTGPALPAVSPREGQTLHGLLSGRSESRIGRDMGISAATVHQYVTSLYRKLRVRSRAELMALFIDSPNPPVAGRFGAAVRLASRTRGMELLRLPESSPHVQDDVETPDGSEP